MRQLTALKGQQRRRPSRIVLLATLAISLMLVGPAADATVVRVRAILPKLPVRHERNAGSGLAFEDAGKHELKGVPDRWRLYRVVSGQA